jgi:CubicO group peptidase (beta-lactamase class C family)
MTPAGVVGRRARTLVWSVSLGLIAACGSASPSSPPSSVAAGSTSIAAQPSLIPASSAGAASAGPSRSDSSYSPGPAWTPVPLPVSGGIAQSLRPFYDAIEGFMTSNHIQAGSLAVMRNRQIVLSNGFGWLDQAHKHTTPPDALFRLASIGKPITAAAIKKLYENGQIRPDTQVFPLLGIHAPRGVPEDPRLKTITVQDLLEHKGGWDVERLGYDPMFASVRIANSLGIASPPNAREIATYVAGLQLQFDPGKLTSYSNVGYMLLGLVIEKVSGMPYLQYIQQVILAPIGVMDIAQGRSRIGDRNAREPSYQDPHTCQDVFGKPADKKTVPCPDGGFAIEPMEAHGGLIGSAPAMVEFMGNYWLDGDPRSGDGHDWTFYGSLPGSFTLARWRQDGVTLAALFDQRGPTADGYEGIKAILDGATERVTAWPAG